MLDEVPRNWKRLEFGAAMVMIEKSSVKYYYKSISYGGGGGNRTRVRKSSAFSSTCVALSIEFNCGHSDRQDGTQRFPEFRIVTRDGLGH